MNVPADYAAQVDDLAGKITEALKRMQSAVQVAAESERTYRKAKAQAWVRASVDGPKLADAKKAWVEAETSDERYARDLADGQRTVYLEAIRSHRATLSAYQTLANLDRAEAEFARTGPR